MRLVLLGAPGSGKGTQARFLRGRLNISSVSTGDILRRAVEEKSEIGKSAEQYMKSGELVPDELVLSLIRDCLHGDDCKNGFILDGFPRSIAQAEALDNIIEIDRAVSIEASDDQILERMAGRRHCPKCGRTYHITENPPETAGICEDCKTQLAIREDDTPEVVKNRLLNYHRITEPVKNYYSKSNRLVAVDGQGGVETTRSELFEALAL